MISKDIVIDSIKDKFDKMTKEEKLEFLDKIGFQYNKIEDKNEAKSKEKSVKDIFVCVYNHDHVGLFKRRNYCTKLICTGFGRQLYNAASVYIGIDSDYIGIKKIELPNGIPVPSNVANGYVVNCNIQESMSFDDMRLIMYNDGKIGPYELGKSNLEEMLEVLKYAYNYYNLGNNNQKQKTK